MTYAQGGIIQASDYNAFLGNATGSGAAINSVWATGRGDSGYGQTALSNVSVLGTVTATQWASAINTLNSISTHQSGTGTGIGAPTTGSLITYLSSVSGNISTVYSNRTTFSVQSTTVNGPINSAAFSSANGVAAQTFIFTRTATFASADQARYFFNSGGELRLTTNTATNTGATTRGADLCTLAQTNFASYTGFRVHSGGGKTGTGGTVVTNLTSTGYNEITTSNTTLCKISSTTSPYTGDYIQLDAKTNGLQGANADNGTVITFYVTLYSAAQNTFPAPPANPPGSGSTTNNTTTEDAINISVTNYLTAVYPESTNLANTWGAVTFG